MSTILQGNGIPVSYVLALSFILFGMALIGLITQSGYSMRLFSCFICIALASAINFVCFSDYLNHVEGQVITLICMLLVVIDCTVALALLLVVYGAGLNNKVE